MGLLQEEENGCTKIEIIPLKEQFSPVDDCGLKVRKPYTITKQRERWTEEEHKKFLEALKLYGRAWRKIEEHVGTKTAVQIRSHAQKFFSKVVRESNTIDGIPVKPIEIPPPRPKRKPMHPYPRKLVSPLKMGISIPEENIPAASPSTSEDENQSPTSVLSAVASDSSSAHALNDFGTEAPKYLPEDCEIGNSSEDERKNLESEISSSCGQESNESSAQSLKLFGKILLINSNVETCDRSTTPVYSNEIKTSNIPCTQTTSDKRGPFPWLTLEVHNPTPVKAQPLYNDEKTFSSSTGSNSCPQRRGEDERAFSSNKLSRKISGSSVNSRRGFMPYKRCLVKQDSNVSSTEIDEEGEKETIRLCL
ncbi:hypothetical protein ABFS83_11G090300 [Erythranthe nasuta]